MSQEIRAIFENGLFRPLDPISLGEQAVVVLTVEQSSSPTASDAPAKLTDQRAALQEMFVEADSLELEVTDDGFSGANHDLVLYGWQK